MGVRDDAPVRGQACVVHDDRRAVAATRSRARCAGRCAAAAFGRARRPAPPLVVHHGRCARRAGRRRRGEGVLGGRRWRWFLNNVERVPGRARLSLADAGRRRTSGSNLYRRNILRRLLAPRRAAVAHVPVQLIVPTGDHFISAHYYDAAPDGRSGGCAGGWSPGSHWSPRSQPALIARWVGEFVDQVEGGTPHTPSRPWVRGGGVGQLRGQAGARHRRRQRDRAGDGVGAGGAWRPAAARRPRRRRGRRASPDRSPARMRSRATSATPAAMERLANAVHRRARRAGRGRQQRGDRGRRAVSRHRVRGLAAGARRQRDGRRPRLPPVRHRR